MQIENNVICINQSDMTVQKRNKGINGRNLPGAPPDHPLQSAAQIRREDCGVYETRARKSKTGDCRQRDDAGADAAAADAAPWRGSEAAPWRVGGLLQRRERAVSAGLPPPSVNAHVSRGSHPSLALRASRACPPGSASTSSARRIATTHPTARPSPFLRSFSQVSRTRDSAGGSRRYAAPEVHTHTARHRLGWWFARRRDGGG
ncbi:uncharacterized protein LOC118644733 [Monomorium pharaonis]|uniref:uncharacterized protein LOC118644733 n=1 Tax=Monomorium pharaonis TaxID=307658 RepID=UPI00174636BB|nr:uncharacterized protein LOC118644733 [Monomorium pharaonis]